MPRLTPKFVLTAALVSFIFISVVLYNTVESNASHREAIYNQREREISKLKEKLNHLGRELQENENEMDSLQRKLENANKENEANFKENIKNDLDFNENHIDLEDNNPVLQAPKEIGGKVKVVHDTLNKVQSNDFKEIVGMSGSCPAVNYQADSGIQMLQAYGDIPFDNPDGGVWKQGWEITYDKQEILKEKKLEVIVVPHSHDDPGWLKTFEGYYQSQTKEILNGMLKYLQEFEDMKFIYAEMSFFELWWSNLGDSDRRKVKEFLDKGQLEIVTGAWVMTDEANSHYYSTVVEMFEGHEFLLNQLNYKPTSHWSIDPFGLSPIITYIAKAGNLTHAAVQRVHYSVKKYLAKQKNLEFVWRQLWAGKSEKTDIFTHMFPFYSYDVPHTCGPDPKVCCQFDFKRMHFSNCPWGIQPQKITEKNVVQRASILADQYRKKAQLYKTNVLLVPLGDDFRYDEPRDWTAQYENYIKLFKQMNADTTLNIHARFGTLKDYFYLLEKRAAEEKKNVFEILSGDFFTYADRDDHYWSGYFTSRPFYKHMDRSLQSYLRSADLVYSLASWNAKVTDKKWSGLELYDSLVDARRALSLFQHHDGVTGTARDDVVVDYAEKMLAAINWCKQIIVSGTEFLMKFPQTRDQGLKVDEEHFVNELPKKLLIEDGGTVVVFNPLGYERKEVACIHVNSIKAKIGSADESVGDIPQQLGPVLVVPPGSDRFAVDKEKYELCFLATLPPFGFARFEIFEALDSSSAVNIYSSTLLESSDFEIQKFSEQQITLKNDKVEAQFNAQSGFLESIKLASSEALPVELNFVHYGARGHNRSFTGGDSLSGAYLFLPDGEAKSLPTSDNKYVVVDGPVRKTVYVNGIQQIQLIHSVSMDVGRSDLLIKNQVDIRKTGNFEVSMRLKTGIIDGQEFYTDLNGFQMIKRERFSKLPLQAHFYPMPASGFIENDKSRLSLLGRQALGIASLKPGWMEVMLDRRLDQDDDRGLAQPVHDNLRTESNFRLLLEELEGKGPEKSTAGYHSISGHFISNELHYPPSVLIGQFDHTASTEMAVKYSGLKKSLPCDIHPVALRTLSMPTVYGQGGTRSTTPQNSVAFVLHRLGSECRAKSDSERICSFLEDDKMLLKDLFADPSKSAQGGSLTMLYSTEEHELNDVTISPMELKTVRINF